MLAVDLIARPPGGRSGVGRYAASLHRELLTMGVDARLVPTVGDALPSRLAAVARARGVDVAAFLASYPVHVPVRPEALVHVTAQTFASTLWLQPGAVVTVHDLFLEDRTAGGRAAVSRLCDAVARLGLRRAAAIVTGSAATAAICEARGLGDRLGITVGSYGVDHALFRRQPVPSEYSRSIGLPDGGPVLLYVGTEAPRKRVDFLIRLLARLRHGGHPSAVLVKVGAPVHPGRREELQALAAALDVRGAVRWLDAVSEQELAWLYNLATVYVSAAEREGFGLPVLEAMACACAVVVTDVPAHREVTAGAGRLVPLDDLDAWVAAVGLVLGDDDVRRAMAARSEERAASFTWRRTAERTLAVYQRVTLLA
jgi:glycosyltransferase involved in cell wall biosynthesis